MDTGKVANLKIPKFRPISLLELCCMHIHIGVEHARLNGGGFDDDSTKHRICPRRWVIWPALDKAVFWSLDWSPRWCSGMVGMVGSWSSMTKCPRWLFIHTRPRWMLGITESMLPAIKISSQETLNPFMNLYRKCHTFNQMRRRGKIQP